MADSEVTTQRASTLDFDDAPGPAPYPADGGLHAYAYLFASFVIELLAWSLPFSYGVFLNFNPSRQTAIVGTLCTGIMYLAYPTVLRATALYPHLCRHIMVVGLALCVAGLVGAAWSSTPWHYVLSQGVAYAVGGALLSFPSVAFLFEWFPERRGLATGILFSGTGIGGIVMPFAIDGLLHRCGERATFLILAGTFVACILPCLPFVKPRIPRRRGPRRERLINVSFLANGMFWPLFICSTLQGLANFIPGIYLPSYSTDIGLSTAAATLVAALVNGASVPGAILIGWATDRYALGAAIMFSTAGAAAAVFLLWGFAHGLAQLVLFAIVYGFCAGGFSAMWPRFASAIARDDHLQATTVYSVFGASRGVGSVLAGPISSALLHHRAATAHGFGYGAGGYAPVILFTGATMLASACGCLFSSFGPPLRGRPA